MQIKDFIEIFTESFDELNTEINETTVYKKIPEWTSMQSLFFIAHLDDSTNVVLNTEDLLNTKTIKDLYLLVKNKI